MLACGTLGKGALADVDVIISDGQLPEDFLVECETHHITVY